MDVEIFIHGVPNGESFWGLDNDRLYFSNFYGGVKDTAAVSMRIQTRQLNGKTYCYYNYFILHDVIGYEGRRNSYFGLTVRMDNYCKDFLTMYKLLDMVFATQVLNKVLKEQNGKLKY